MPAAKSPSARYIEMAKLAKYSQDTAYRDPLDLLERSVLVKNPTGGRSTSFSLAAIQREQR